jgi:hypothetical protein
LRTVLLIAAALVFASFDATAQSYTVADLSCTKGPYRLKLPKSYRAVRGLGTIRRDRVLKIEDRGPYTATHRELRFNGLEIELVTFSNEPGRYALTKAIITTSNWRIAGALRVGAPAKSALRGLANQSPRDGELEFSGATDTVRVNLAAGRVLDVEYSCQPD